MFAVRTMLQGVGEEGEWGGGDIEDDWYVLCNDAITAVWAALQWLCIL